MACYETQADMLRLFRPHRECLQAAPCYQFMAPPHPWPPFYERFVRGIDGAAWRRLARQTLERSKVSGPL